MNQFHWWAILWIVLVSCIQNPLGEDPHPWGDRPEGAPPGGANSPFATFEEATPPPEVSATPESTPSPSVDGSGGTNSLKFPFPEGETWVITRGYNNATHVDYGYDWVDDRFAIDFALSGCEGWRKPIRPIRDGVVEIAAYDFDGYGHYVMVDHGSGFKSRYAHFDEPMAEVGEFVTTDDVIGLMGNSGAAFGTACPSHPGTHLHIAYYENGNGIKPEPMSGHIDLSAGCWYDHFGWSSCGEAEIPIEEPDLDPTPTPEPEPDTEPEATPDPEPDPDPDPLLLLEPPCSWNVPTDFSTIQGAIDGATTGQVICVAAGNYHEDIVFSGIDITVRGVDGSSVTHLHGMSIELYDAAVVIINQGETRETVFEGFTIHGTAEVAMMIEDASPTIRNVVVDCGSSTNGLSIYGGSASPFIHNTRIEHCDRYGVTLFGNVNNAEFHNVVSAFHGSAGFRAGGESNFLVENSVIYGNGAIGVWLLDSSATVRNSIIMNHSHYGVHAEREDHYLISLYNTFYDHGVDDHGDRVVGRIEDIQADPLFSNAANGIFTVWASSSTLYSGSPDSTMSNSDNTRNSRGAYGGPFGESW
jgi:hypothetical protein